MLITWSLLSLSLSALAPPCGPFCRCLPLPTVQEAHAKAEAVFLGRVLAQRELEYVLRDRDGREYRLTATEHTVVRLASWKRTERTVSDTVRVTTSNTSCGPWLEIGKRYVVYAERDQHFAGALLAPGCSRTRIAETADKDLAGLGSPLNGQVPQDLRAIAEHGAAGDVRPGIAPE